MDIASGKLNRGIIWRQAMLAALLCFSLPVTAKTIISKMPSGLTISADYHKGQPAQPAILLLHGFMQTAHSQPMNALADNLASRGYTTLIPTISLGVNKRNQSMACEAMHTHTIEDDVAEIGYWTNWLNKTGYKKIVLIGFSSTGDYSTLLYAQQSARPKINKIILTSFNPIFIDSAELKKTREFAKHRHDQELQPPQTFTLGYCKNNFTATSKSYLSFARYDEQMALDLIGNKPASVDIIFGSKDATLPENWAARISQTNSSVKIHTIKNANHFFEGTYEFDLAEQVEHILKRTSSL